MSIGQLGRNAFRQGSLRKTTDPVTVDEMNSWRPDMPIAVADVTAGKKFPIPGGCDSRQIVSLAVPSRCRYRP